LIGNDLVTVDKPDLPDTWDYDNSVKKVSGLLVSWRNITADILMELWIAREILSKEGKPSKDAQLPTWKQYLEDVGLSKRTVNNWLSRWTVKEEENPPPLPVGEHYSIIYCDPPWRYDFSETTSRKIEEKYPTMDLKDLKKIKLPCNGDAVIFMWATAPKLREALELMEAWDFDYKTHAIWDKEKIGMGYWFRGQHELLMVGVKGEFSPPSQKHRVSSVFRIPRSKGIQIIKKLSYLLELKHLVGRFGVMSVDFWDAAIRSKKISDSPEIKRLYEKKLKSKIINRIKITDRIQQKAGYDLELHLEDGRILTNPDLLLEIQHVNGISKLGWLYKSQAEILSYIQPYKNGFHLTLWKLKDLKDWTKTDQFLLLLNSDVVKEIWSNTKYNSVYWRTKNYCVSFRILRNLPFNYVSNDNNENLPLDFYKAQGGKK